MNKNELRKCDHKLYDGTYYFHKYIEQGATHLHPEDPQKDVCYVWTKALIENIETGEMKICDPENIVFTT